jgi:hypothetical protein
VTPAPSLGAALDRIGEMQTPLPGIVAVLIGLAALAAVGVQEIWLLARHVNTIAHEGRTRSPVRPSTSGSPA